MQKRSSLWEFVVCYGGRQLGPKAPTDSLVGGLEKQTRPFAVNVPFCILFCGTWQGSDCRAEGAGELISSKQSTSYRRIVYVLYEEHTVEICGFVCYFTASCIRSLVDQLTNMLEIPQP